MIDDPILGAVKRVPVLAPDEVRADKVRARCRAVLARRARQARREPGPRSIPLLLAQAVIGGVCVVYLSAVLGALVTLRGVL